MTCDHVQTYIRNPDILCSFEIVHAYYVTCIAKDSYRRKSQDCICMVESCEMEYRTNCTTGYRRIHACLSCIYFGCYLSRHIHNHARISGHALAVDTMHGQVYCFVCQDYQYELNFERISKKQYEMAARKRGLDVSFLRYVEPHFNPDLLLKARFVHAVNVDPRGLTNLGNTCYMSVVIWALVHAPVVRDYFLALRHRCKFARAMPPDPDSTVPSCFACEMSNIMQEFYSGKTGPFSPHRMLVLLWLRETEFRRYEPNDSHLCYLAFLNNLHLSCVDDKYFNEQTELCKCIFDTLFTGSMHYQYKCQECENISIQITPFKSISLHLHSHSATDLYGCLQNLTAANDIPTYYCNFCAKMGHCVEKMSLSKIPIILSFHLNQFDSKTCITFPEFLDMSEFMTSSSAKSSSNEVGVNTQKAAHKFYLFAVVEHRGTLEDGHYLCYVRRNKENWFQCSDEEVRSVGIENVLNVPASMLFYHRQVLEYKTSNN